MRYLYLFLFVSISTYAQSSLTIGSVEPKIALNQSGEQTYALYLPLEYDESRSYPTVFVFDNKARGASVVQRYSIASELTKSIIIGVNYTLNDTLTVANKQVEELIKTTIDRYAIDSNKIILSGINEGALFASSIAQLSNDIYGVLVVNNIYIDRKIIKKREELKFTIFSSDEGVNFYKLNNYSKDYTFKKIIAGYHIYNQNDWPESGYLAAGLVELLLDENTLDEQVQRSYKSDLAFGEYLYGKQQHLYAYDFVNNLKNTYKKRVDLTPQKELLKKIRGSAIYRSKRSQYNIFKYEESLLIEDFQYYLFEDSKNSYFDNLGWWGSQMDDLDSKIDVSDKLVQAGKSAKRVKAYVQELVEQQYIILKTQDPNVEQLLFINVLRTLVDPVNYDAFIQAVSLSAQERDYKAAFFYLEELLKAGYTDYEGIYSIPDTITIRIGEEYNEIVKAYLGKSRY